MPVCDGGADLQKYGTQRMDDMAKSRRNSNDQSHPNSAQAKVAALGGVLEKAGEEALRLGMPRANTGHLLLASLHFADSLLHGLLADRGADPAKLATHVERLARLDEGAGEDEAMSAALEQCAAEAMARVSEGASAPPPALLADLALWHALGEATTAAVRALDNAGHAPEELRARLEKALGLDTGGGTQDAGEGREASADKRRVAPSGARYRLTPEQYAAMALDGDYKTAAQKKPFRAEVRGGDLHIFSGWRFQKKAYDGEGNSIFFDTERLIRESVEFVRRQGEVELGSCAENRVPEPDTFEAFLRQFSISGNLASYIPAILETLGAIRIEKRRGGVHWAVPGDRQDANGEGTEVHETTP